jgi:multidrug resistance efflux pump
LLQEAGVTGPESPTSTVLAQPIAPSPLAAQTPPIPRKSRRRKVVVVLAILALLAALGGGGAYLAYSSQFVSTDNAQVDGDKIDIDAPASGVLMDWAGQVGTSVAQNQIIGRVAVGSADGAQMPIKSPSTGTIAVNDVVNGQWVTAGTELATAYDLDKVYLTARVDETDVAAVKPGAAVDISVDAYPGVPVTGLVSDIDGAAADEFSLFPQSDSSGNFQKVTQVIPVRIELTDTDSVRLVPGMNVTVHIHKGP